MLGVAKAGLLGVVSALEIGVVKVDGSVGFGLLFSTARGWVLVAFRRLWHYWTECPNSLQ